MFCVTYLLTSITMSDLRNDLYCVEWGVKLYSLTRLTCELAMGSASHTR